VNREHVSDRLGEHIEGDLSLAEQSRVDRHLAECAACSAELRELRSTIALLRGLPDPEPPARLRAEVMRRIAAGEGRGARLPRLLSSIGEPRFAAALAASFAALAVLSISDFGAGVFLGTSPEPSPDSVTTQGNTGGFTVADAPGASQRLPGRSASEMEGMRTALVAFESARPPQRPTASHFGLLGGTAPPVPLRDLDGELEGLVADPALFLEQMRRTAAPDRRPLIAPLVEHSARRGDVTLVARTVGMAVPAAASQR